MFQSNLRSNSHRSVAQGDMIGAIADWCECLSGRVPLRMGLRALGQALGAEAVALSRVKKGQTDRGRIIVCDVAASARSEPALTSSFALTLLGDYAAKSKPGSLWFSSMFDSNLSPRLTEFQSRRQLKELVVIPIATSEKQTDFLELHFGEKRDMDQLGLLGQVSETLVRTWSGRAAGLFAEAHLSRQSEQDLTAPSVPLLSIQNPARLSRAEYRVCLMISHGLTGAAIQKELSISNSTLRTHLRNIYAKTDTASLAELTFVLLSKTRRPSAGIETEIQRA